MRRKPMFWIFISLLLVFILIPIAYKVATHKRIQPAGRISGPLPFFPVIQIEMLESTRENLAADALKETTRSLLQSFRPDLLGEPWQSAFLFIDLYPGGNKEVVFSLSLPPDQGILVILTREKDYYIPLLVQDNMLPITRLEQLTLSPGHFLLLTREEHNEMTGAYSETRLLKIWSLGQNKLDLVWSENSYQEINWPISWQNPADTRPLWQKLTQNLSVVYSPAPTPVVRVSGTQELAEASGPVGTLPAPYDFKQKKNRPIQAEYFWNDDWHRFILKTGFYLAPGQSERQDVAVLKDLDLDPESLAVGEKKLYRVQTRWGEIFQTEKLNVRENSP